MERVPTPEIDKSRDDGRKETNLEAEPSTSEIEKKDALEEKIQPHRSEKKSDPKSEPKKSNADTNNADEFEQISSGAVELDDNSQVTTKGHAVAENDINKRISLSDVNKIEGDEDTIHGGGNFEAVDTNTSGNAHTLGTAINESDALGDSDMTLPNAKVTLKEGERDEIHESIKNLDEEMNAEDSKLEPKNNANIEDSKASDNVVMEEANDSVQPIEDVEDAPQEEITENAGIIHENTEKVLENIEEDAEGDDQPVENVQEPEESDVCLIPDDTETQVTEAEKEQAILARENAEKEAEEAESEKEKNNEAAKDATATLSPNVSKDMGPCYDAGDAKVAVAESSIGENVCEGEMPDPDEPLLEELHPSPADSSMPIKVIISWIVATLQKCSQCNEDKLCGFRYKNAETTVMQYLCEQPCCDALLHANPGKFFIRRKKFLVEEVPVEGANKNSSQNCLQCKEKKECKYFFKQDDEWFYVCNDDCFNLLNAEESDKFKLKRHSIRVRNIGATISKSSTNATEYSNKKATSTPESRVVARTAVEAEAARLERVASFTRRCAECFKEVTINDKNLLWETMDFCNEVCLGKYQRTIGSSCQTCHGDVPHQALGKYCVRFGFDIRQFCCAICLNEYKKGLKTCSCCQKDISSGGEGFLAPVGDKEQFKDFCSQACMRRYDSMCNPKKKLRADTCAVCNNEKPVRVEILLDEKDHSFCSNPCFSAFKFVSNIIADQCGMCNKYFERKSNDSFTIYTDRRPKVFCSRICLNVFIIVNRRIVSCQWCKVKKYNFDMIYKQHEAQEILMCSLNCLTLYDVSMNAFSRTIAKCDNCTASATPQYHLTMSDASMRNFCTYQCVMQFQSQFARAPLTLDTEPTATKSQQSSLERNSVSIKNNAPFPTGLPKRVKLRASQQQQQKKLDVSSKSGMPMSQKSSTPLPVISTVSSLASGETMIGNITVRRSRARSSRKLDSPPPLVQLSSMPPTNSTNPRGRPRKNVEYGRSPSPAAASASTLNVSGKRIPSSTASLTIQPGPGQIETKIIAVPPFPSSVRNVQTNCKPQTATVGLQCEPETDVKCIQTQKDYSNKVLIPVPVPIFVPQPMYMYSAAFPVPVPIPLPIPVPIFIPTTRNSAQGIMKEIKKIQDKMPADPFEAELLMMAEMVAEEKHISDSDSDEEIKPDPGIISLQYQNSVQQQEEVTNNTYGEDVLQMALKMATGEYDHPPQHSTVDLETAMTANTITNPPIGLTSAHDSSLSHINAGHHLQQTHPILETQRGRGRKRGTITSPISPRNNRSPVKRHRIQEMEPQMTPEPMQPLEKPDANMCLKYTFGVNAWKQWVMTKNADLEKSTIRKRPFKTELLQMTADELNYSLCLFVKEVRKPNGTEYAPDTIYYLVLGIQQYLYENGRIDNIFTDPYYERFTDCLDEVARKFSVLYNDSQYIVTRVEEEHLWECKQLGAHSPHVLLSTLMFFNTKHFNLTTVEEHMQLSFSHIMKHWKRSSQNTKTPGQRNVLLRFYPPQAGLDANPRKKKVYEQQENEENPLRCPVRLYEFYLSKCPESVKTRNDVFYLQPERSCVPDSPVWYSTQALSQDALQKMLHRVKMVKEINIALLTS